MKTFLLATAIGALAASSVLAYDTEARTGLRARLAVNIAEMAAAACAVDGYNVSAAVTDRSGALLALIRYEKASAGTIDASVQKAFSSASSHSPTSAMVENLVGSPNEAAFTDISGHFVSGGVPIKVGEETIGALGVAGAPNDSLDEDCANIAIEEFKTRLK
ncbi:GlcG/HbpS family heme-binding protein [Agrobacterium pusense]|uniref:GlcG/HbpS family heme-binding protein n=1 Tax=Agrobacterium pusense TaxID=648995 RepID=UPI001C6E4A33|nr:heme-binding protein [Agrobacterium pusense]MBW9069881.1 heme-binding protein [Agrobacterium pusense]MBW9084880.1 heme-binding protein [Agrobacterium pusense]MBW9125246.1 heme-binding protein [Agrobacterium pusense]MBW9137661.1 heme-binding protein [Agrobacterium pusense]